MMTQIASALLAATVLVAVPATVHAGSMDHGDIKHGEMDHGKMDHSKMIQKAKTQASGRGVINSIAADKKSINITHEPMPDLNWPQMTMDLPVTQKVDLSKAKAGDTVDFTIKLGFDKKYRIIEINPASN